MLSVKWICDANKLNFRHFPALPTERTGEKVPVRSSTHKKKNPLKPEDRKTVRRQKTKANTGVNIGKACTR